MIALVMIPIRGIKWRQELRRSSMSETLTYTLPAMHCANCEAAVSEEVSAVAGVESVLVDLETKRVTVRGEGLADGAIRAAIEEVGFEAA
jgi:copper chaperone